MDIIPCVDLHVKRCDPNAKLPTKGSAHAAGFDLYSIEDVDIPPQERKLINTGITVVIPPGCYGRIAPKSGLALNFGIDTLAGVVDRDYRGQIKILLINTDKNKTFNVIKYNSVAQLILEKISENVNVVEISELDETSRGSGGFGSTGST